MQTIEELEKYLEEQCYSFHELSIGNHHAAEGHIIEKDGNAYNFCYSERGNKRVVKSFSTESELVKFALEELDRDKWSKAHIVAFTTDMAVIAEAENMLQGMKIGYERNDIPCFNMQGHRAYRIYVFGKDILLLEEFKKKYMCR